MFFTFGVLTYNHECFIIEHLESIRFQIENYSNGRTVKLIIADDGSTDATVPLVKAWLDNFGYLFSEVILLCDGVNRGVCFNYTQIWKYVTSDCFKITAGDDVYSYENIFDFSSRLKDVEIISGMPLLLIGSEIVKSKLVIFNIMASACIYKNNFLRRMRCLSLTNTPSLFFRGETLKLPGLADFINQFKVVEDFPMQIKIAEILYPLRFHQSDKVIVYYRRTLGSIYLVRKNAYYFDKIAQFEYAIESASGVANKLLLKNRLFCFKVNNRFLKVILNVNYFVYFFDVVMNFPAILRRFFGATASVSSHQAHYSMLKIRADKYVQSIQ